LELALGSDQTWNEHGAGPCIAGKGRVGVTVGLDRRFFVIILGTVVLSCFSAAASAGVATTDTMFGEPMPIMRPNESELHRQIDAYEAAPAIESSLFESRAVNASIRSQNLLGRIDYVPAERNQQPTGNCWVWAGTGLLEIENDLQNGVRERLSVQYVDSNFNGGEGQYWAGNGGTLADFVGFYRQKGIAVPWSNANASFQDGRIWCVENNRAYVSASTISTVPHYRITGIEERRIVTRGVLKSSAITRIKAVIDQHRGVYMTFRLPNEAAWTDFNRFWMNEGEEAVFDLSPYEGRPWEPWTSGAHAVLCVGYDETDGSWIMLNSWGTAQGNRPHGLFRIRMDMDYSATYPYAITVPATEWETVDVAIASDSSPLPSEGPYANHLLPCRIEAEDYDLGGSGVAYADTTAGNAGGRYRNDDVDIEPLATGSGYAVAYTRTGEWLRYTVTVEDPGTYDLRVRLSSPYEGSTASVRIDDGQPHLFSIPDTGSFQTYALLSTPWHLEAGTHTILLQFDGAGQNCDYLEFVRTAGTDPTGSAGKIRVESSPSGASVFLDGEIVGITPMTIGGVAPGTHRIELTKRGWERASVSGTVSGNETLVFNLTLVRLIPTPYRSATLPCSIQAEDYNLGGEGIGYHDNDWWNLGGAYRNDGVDIEPVAGTDNCKVAWVRDGEWLGYTVQNPAAGRYRVALVGCALTVGASIGVFVDEQECATLLLPYGTDYDRFGEAVTELEIPAGTHVVRLEFLGRQNLDRLDLARIGEMPPVTPTPTPVPASPVPGRIEAEDYDAGSNGQAYFDRTPQNLGGVYRNDSVDITRLFSGASPVVFATESGEWLQYTANVSTAGLYRCTIRMGGTGSPASVLLSDGDQPLLQIAAPFNGTTTGLSTHTRTIALASGIHRFTLSFTGNLTVDYMDLRRAVAI
jgi:hypothetical protein